MAGLILPDAAWRTREGLAELCAALGDVRYVGGAVRDTLLGLDVQDVDIATTLRPEDVMDLARAARFKPVPTGIAHGTVTVVLPSGPVEVTTLRRDVSTDGRHAIVEFADDWREDAARRDFTMNALYVDPASGEVFDYFGGIDDLNASRVRFIGDPLQRIAEDHLRILRFFRFLARFGDAPDPEGLAACVARANDLMALSRERIRDELLKLLVAKNAVPVMRLMVENGILTPVLPEIDEHAAERLKFLVQRESFAGLTPDPIRRLSALLPVNQSTSAEVAARLRLSNATRMQLICIEQRHRDHPWERDDHLSAAYALGKQCAIDRILFDKRLNQTEAMDAIELLCTWERPTLPVKGSDIIRRGLSAGPEVSRAIREIEQRWIAEGFPLKDRTDAIADDVVAQALRDASKV